MPHATLVGAVNLIEGPRGMKDSSRRIESAHLDKEKLLTPWMRCLARRLKRERRLYFWEVADEIVRIIIVSPFCLEDVIALAGMISSSISAEGRMS